MAHYGPKSESRYDDRSSYRGGGDSYGLPSSFGGNRDSNLGGSLKTLTWDLSRLPVFEKNFYMEHPAVSRRPESEAEEWRRKSSITVIGRGIPKVCFAKYYIFLFTIFTASLHF